MKSNEFGLSIWDNEFENKLFTTEEIVQSNIRVAIMCELIDARLDRGITRPELEKLTGIKQSKLQRIETGDGNPRLSTLIKLLLPLGKTLAIVSIPFQGET